MDWQRIVEAVLVVLGVGGVAVALIRARWATKDVAVQSLASGEAKFRQDLMTQVNAQNARIAVLEVELENWRKRYFKLEEEFQQLRQICINAQLIDAAEDSVGT